jgi:polygalacturonase
MSPRWPLVAALFVAGCGGSSASPAPSVAPDAAGADDATVAPQDAPEAEASSSDAASRYDSTDAQLGTCDARDFGATGDGVTNDAAAIQKAIDQCAKVVVSAGNYQIAPLFLKSNFTLQLDPGATLKGPTDVMGYYAGVARNGGSLPSLINGSAVRNATLTGSGVIDGVGAGFWAQQKAAEAAKMADPPRPHLMHFEHALGLHIENVTLQNSPKFHVLIETSDDVTVSGVTITAPANSPNTDGIDPKSCKHVTITNCHISVGDDNVAITSAGIPVPTASDILVSDCVFGSGHGVSIGSFASGGVSRFTVQHCQYTGTQYGIRIKTARDRGGPINSLVYDDLQMTNVRNVVYFTEYYPDIPDPDTDPAQPLMGTTPAYTDIQIKNVTATGASSAGVLIGLPESPISNVTFQNVSIAATSGLKVRNAHDVHFIQSSISVTKDPPLVLQENAIVDGLSLSDAGSNEGAAADDAATEPLGDAGMDEPASNADGDGGTD